MDGITATKEDPVVAEVAAALHARGVTTLRFDLDPAQPAAIAADFLAP